MNLNTETMLLQLPLLLLPLLWWQLPIACQRDPRRDQRPWWNKGSGRERSRPESEIFITFLWAQD